MKNPALSLHSQTHGAAQQSMVNSKTGRDKEIWASVLCSKLSALWAGSHLSHSAVILRNSRSMMPKAKPKLQNATARQSAPQSWDTENLLGQPDLLAHLWTPESVGFLPAQILHTRGLQFLLNLHVNGLRKYCLLPICPTPFFMEHSNLFPGTVLLEIFLARQHTSCKIQRAVTSQGMQEHLGIHM